MHTFCTCLHHCLRTTFHRSILPTLGRRDSRAASRVPTTWHEASSGYTGTSSKGLRSPDVLILLCRICELLVWFGCSDCSLDRMEDNREELKQGRYRQSSSSASQRLLYSLSETAYSLSMSKRGLAYLVASGAVPTVKIGGRTMIAARVLHQFAEQGTSRNIVPPKGR